MWTPYRTSGTAARAVATTAALVCLASVLGLVESVLVPPLPVPGVRLGLANIAVVIALSLLGPRAAFEVGVARVIVVSLATGSLGGIGSVLALAGCLSAWLVMWLLSCLGGRFSLVGWSVGGSAAHVAAQLAVASALAGTAAPMTLLPLSLTLSLFTGLATGFLARALVSRVPLASVVATGK